MPQDCGIGLMIVSPVTRFELDNIVPGLLHAMKFQILSMCRTQPVEMSSIFRGIIDADDVGTLRQASTMDAALRAGLPVPRQAPSLAAASSSYDTDKHKVLWIVPTSVLWETAGIKPPKGKGKLLKGKGAKGAKDIRGQGEGKGSPESEP